MGINERREREKQKRRNDILNAAEKVFFEKGISNATMDDVAEMAELSKGTLYLYFKSKEDLYRGINFRALNIMKEMFKEAVKSHTTGIEKVRAIGQAYYRFYKTYPDYFNALLHFEATELEINGEAYLNLPCMQSDEKLVSASFKPDSNNPPPCMQLGERSLQILSDAIREGINDGTIQADLDPIKTAYLLWSQSNGVIQIIARKGKCIEICGNFNPEDLITEFFNFVNKALKPDN